MKEEIIKIKQGRYLRKMTVRTDDKYIYMGNFGFNDEIRLAIKDMQGAKWMGGDWIPEAERIKFWRVDNIYRNLVNLAYMKGENPFARYDQPLKPFVDSLEFVRPLRQHQKEGVGAGLLYRCVMLAFEMGLGKSLTSFEIMERSGFQDWWYVGTTSSIPSVQLDAFVWQCKVKPRYMTYDELKSILKNWKAGDPPPHGIVFDESSRGKSWAAQRTQAMYYVANEMRKSYKDDCYIIEMTGTPAPKNPVDLWSQIEILCPGIIKEGNVDKFKYRLAIFERTELKEGVTFPKLVCWRDGDPTKCNICGKFKAHPLHEPGNNINEKAHAFVPLRDEIGRLYRCLKGVMLPKFKKDCLDLPPKIYQKIYVKPTIDVLRAAKLITATSKSVISGLIRCRELSDGFQYSESCTKIKCPNCVDGEVIFNGAKEVCFACGGTCQINEYGRETHNVNAPKLKALVDFIEDIDSRIVVYAAFTASIDLIESTVTKLGWKVIRVDGRGWHTNLLAIDGKPLTDRVDMLKVFQDKANTDKIMFLAHPGSGGMGVTLTAAEVLLYYSNDYNAESRIQSEDRIHRMGMGDSATIVDLIHLPTDELVLENLQKKRRLQSLTLGEIQAAFDKES